VSWDRLRGTYDQVAETYEAKFLDELDGKPRDRELLQAFAEGTGDPVVELGCGPGQIGAFVRERGRSLIGLDFSPEMARLAAARLDAGMMGDLRRLPIATASVGGLLAFYSLIHVPRPEVVATFGELARVLRPGGRLLLSAHEGEGEYVADEFVGEPVPFIVTFFQLDELVAACEVSGLDVVRAERRPPYADESTTRLYVEAVRG
jgi:SAM-dependent methyltransferase